MKKIILSLLIAIIGFGAGWYTLAPGLDFFLEQAKNVRNPNAVHNGAWRASMDIGSSRATALFRALTAKVGLGANSSDEAIYWLAIKDKNADGSFTIYVSPRQPNQINNWLPTPEQKEPIMLTMRMYAPRPEVLKAPEKSPMPEIILINEARN
jgi:hypothetical protein